MKLVSLCAVLALVLTSCGGTESSAPPVPAADEAPLVQDVPPVIDEEPAEEPAAEEPMAETATNVGARDNPIPVPDMDDPEDTFTVYRVGDWMVRVLEVQEDAADIVKDENMFNDPPPAGYQFVMIRLFAEYVGEDTGNVWVDMSYKVLGSGGNTFDERCGVIPNDITDTGETFPGGEIDGNLCFAVPADQIDGALLILDRAFSFTDSDRLFFALQ